MCFKNLENVGYALYMYKTTKGLDRLHWLITTLFCQAIR